MGSGQMSDSLCRVYCLSFSNGKKYIGVTIDLERRLWEHENRVDVLVGRAWKRHGKPQIRILAVCETEYAYWYERRVIEWYSTISPAGYNLMDGGMGGRKMSDKTRKKMSKSHTGLVMTVKARDKLSKRQRGTRHSLEHREKIAKSLRGNRHSIETKCKMSKSQQGRRHSLETRHKMSEAQKLRWKRRKVN